MAQHHREEDAFMVPGMGAQPVPVKEWVAANDNVAGSKLGRLMRGQLTAEESAEFDEISVFAVPVAAATSTERGPFERPPFTQFQPDKGQYIGLTRSVGKAGDPNGCADDLVTREVKRDWNANLPRTGQFMQTFTGRKFWPLGPRPNEVCIRDIAHSLSLQCRYAGHCRRFYSVAEHSTLIARWLVGKDKTAALCGLLHDASEAYLVDVPRPLKPFLTNYKEAEAKVMEAVCARFGLPIETPAVVHEADERIIADELVNLVPMDWHARHDDPLGVTLRYWSPAEAEEEFLETFRALTGAGEVG